MQYYNIFVPVRIVIRYVSDMGVEIDEYKWE